MRESTLNHFCRGQEKSVEFFEKLIKIEKKNRQRMTSVTACKFCLGHCEFEKATKLRCTAVGL